MANSSSGLASKARRFLPILGWIRAYRHEWLWPDVFAGVALWAVMVPEGMAYADIVGVPPIMGLYTIVPALLAYALLGTSRQLVVGPDTATSLISAVTVGAVATQGTAEFNTLTSTLAVLIGIFFFSFGVYAHGVGGQFYPHACHAGLHRRSRLRHHYRPGAASTGISGASGDFFTKAWNVLQHLPDVSVGPVLTGILCLTAMLLFRYMAPDIPAALVVMAIATILIGLLGGEATGVQVAGHIPSGLPHLTSPNLDPTILYELAPGALAIVLIGYAEALGAAKAATIQSGGDINPNQELVAHGPANILSGLFGGFLVVGSLSKTSVAIAAGARSQVANLIAAALCFFTLILLTSLFRNMPQPALAAIVIAAMLHLTKPKYLRELFARSRWSFANAVIVIAGELTLGVLEGIALGVVVSLLTLIYVTSHPHGAVLGQLPDTEAYRSVQRHPETITFPGLLILRIGGNLFFASVGHVSEALKASLAARPDVKRVLLDFGPVNFIDISAGDELLSLIKALRSRGITLAFARVRDAVRDDMRLAGIEAIVGPSNFHERTTDGVRAWLQ